MESTVSTDDLPIPTPAAELNRVIFAARALDSGEGAAYESVLGAASAQNFGGRIVDHKLTLAFGAALGLIQRTGNHVGLTRRGRKFLALNTEQTYELTEEQQAFLNAECIGASAYAEVIANVLTGFHLDRKGALIGPLSEQRCHSQLSINLLGFLRETGFLLDAGNTMRVAPTVQSEAARLRSTIPISLTELRAILEARTNQGAAAERWTEEYERQRLRSMGCSAEADAVRAISELDVCAGYDIESFDGLTRPFEYGRFIEVKSTTLQTTEFIWSRNEIEIARKLKGRYWIYLLSSYGEDDGHDLTIIQDPIRELRKGGAIVLEPLTYRAVVNPAHLPVRS